MSPTQAIHHPIRLKNGILQLEIHHDGPRCRCALKDAALRCLAMCTSSPMYRNASNRIVQSELRSFLIQHASMIHGGTYGASVHM
jgi:hypothetical protein